MAAILGLDAERVLEACREALAEGIAGRRREPREPERRGTDCDCRARAMRSPAPASARRRSAPSVSLPLPVSAPFHCALMKPAEERLAPELRATDHGQTRPCRWWPTLTRNPRRRPRRPSRRSSRRCRRRCAGKLSSRRLASEGVTTYVEVGPGTVLSGLVRKIHREATALSFGSPDDLTALAPLMSL